MYMHSKDWMEVSTSNVNSGYIFPHCLHFLQWAWIFHHQEKVIKEKDHGVCRVVRRFCGVGVGAEKKPYQAKEPSCEMCVPQHLLTAVAGVWRWGWWGEKGVLETSQTAFVRVQERPWDSDPGNGKGLEQGRMEWAGLWGKHQIPKSEVWASTPWWDVTYDKWVLRSPGFLGPLWRRPVSTVASTSTVLEGGGRKDDGVPRRPTGRL